MLLDANACYLHPFDLLLELDGIGSKSVGFFSHPKFILQTVAFSSRIACSSIAFLPGPLPLCKVAGVDEGVNFERVFSVVGLAISMSVLFQLMRIFLIETDVDISNGQRLNILLLLDLAIFFMPSLVESHFFFFDQLLALLRIELLASLLPM